MMSDMRTPIIVGSDKATQHILAPTQNDLVAKQDYAEGALFIFNNGLYKTTAAITTGDNIIIGSGTGTNAEPSNKTVVEELGSSSAVKLNPTKNYSVWTTNDCTAYQLGNLVFINIYLKGNPYTKPNILTDLPAPEEDIDVILPSASGNCLAQMLTTGILKISSGGFNGTGFIGACVVYKTA